MNSPAGAWGSQEPVFDAEITIASVQGDISLLKEVIELMLVTAQENLNEIREAVALGDGRVLEQSAHKLRGAVAIFGARRVYHCCLALELIGCGGDLNNATQSSARLIEEMGRLRQALTDFATTGQSY